MTVGPPAVLFVDDEASVLEGIALNLRNQAFRILTAASAVEALECLLNEPIAVVVSDEQMPGMGGTAFLTEVRRRHPATIRMVLSGSSDPRAIARAVNEASLFRYLIKPCSPADLILAVQQGIEAHGKRSCLAPAPTRPLDVGEALTHMNVEFQPIFTATGTLLGHEALLRLPDRFGAGAADFMAAAERSDRLWEAERAIRTVIAGRVPTRPASSVVFVNLHPTTLLDPQIYTRRDPLAPFAAATVLEITERGSLAEVDDLPERIAALRGLGYRVAIDDMGSGYSGLTTFTRLLPDFVKFDRELTHGMQSSPAKRNLVTSLTTVCNGLGIATVAEGIETSEDLSSARAAGCTHLQGFHVGRPGGDYVTTTAWPVEA